MRIALLAGGSSIHTIRWANGLSAAGAEVHLITQHALVDNLRQAVQVTQFKCRGGGGYFSMVPAVCRLLESSRPDVVSAHYASGYATTARLAGYRPWMLSVWGSDVYDFPCRSRLHRWWLRKNLEAADLVGSTSHCMAEQTRSIAPSLGEIPITPFGVDIAAFARPADGARSTLGQGAEIVIGTVKKLAPKYGVDTLIRAYSLLRRRLAQERVELLPRLRLRIVGDGPQRAELEALARELELVDDVTFAGHVQHERVPEELHQLDVFVALSRLDSESFGVAVIEAGAAGRPVVVSDAGGLPEVVKDGETGIVVPRDDPDAAAGALYKLVMDPELRKRMGRNGFEHVSQTYDWSSSVNTMLGALERTVQLGTQRR